jgi:hypothetical protein
VEVVPIARRGWGFDWVGIVRDGRCRVERRCALGYAGASRFGISYRWVRETFWGWKLIRLRVFWYVTTYLTHSENMNRRL